MYASNFKKYVDAIDVTKVPADTITYPSKNAFIYKGVIYTRPGITNDGTPKTDDNDIIGEEVWKDQFYSPKFLRVKRGGTLQMKAYNTWIPLIFPSGGIDSNSLRVRFATQLDNTQTLTPLTKKRLFFVDGTTNIYEWSGALATITSVVGAVVSFDENTTPQGLGFDRGDVGGAKNIIIARFDTNGNYIGQEAYVYSEAGATPGQLTLDSTPTPLPNAGDILISSPITHLDVITGYICDDIYSYKNAIIVAGLQSAVQWASSALTPLDFTPPGTPTAITPYQINIDGFFTAMSSRDDTLWISSADDWWKLNKLLDANEGGTFEDLKKFDQPERNGALPFAISKYNKDLIFLSQAKQVRQITTTQITGQDDIVLLSDEVENMFGRLDCTETRLYYQNRYLYITVPIESQLLVLDMLGNPDLQVAIAWMPPQTVPISLMSYWDGVQYGHSNCNDQTFTVFSGDSDLGTDIESTIAFGYIGSTDRHKMNLFTEFGLNGRANVATSIAVKHYWEFDGSKQLATTTIDVSKIKVYSILDDLSWAMWPWSFRSWAGADMENDPLRRFFVFDIVNAASWFEYRPVMTVTGKGKQFHLIGWGLNNVESPRKKDSALFISK